MINSQQLTKESLQHPQISINQQELRDKIIIVQKLLKQDVKENILEILQTWPGERLRKSLQKGQISRKKHNTRYYGQVCNQMIHGYGLLIYQQNQIRFYQGQFQNNCKHGQGFQYINGDVYLGQYVNNKPQDESGVFLWQNGDVFIGSFLNGLKHGKGRWSSGKDVYSGGWKLNKPEGQALIQTTTSIYEGAVKNGYKHGIGCQKFTNGDKYQGSYANGKPEGQGAYYWNNGAIYKGEFQNGFRYGYGEWHYGSERYEGYYVNDKKTGNGLYVWEGGSYYKGYFMDDLRHGFGQMHWNENSYYIGDWKEGVQHGKGQFWQFGKLIRSGTYKFGKPIEQKIEKYNNEEPQKKDEIKKSISPNSKNKKQKLSKQKQSHHFIRRSIGVHSFSNQNDISKEKEKKREKLLLPQKKMYRYQIPKSNKEIPTSNKEVYFKNKREIPHQKIDQSYDKKRVSKILPRIQKMESIENFTQTQLSPIKWNNFKHVRGHINYKLPNLN